MVLGGVHTFATVSSLASSRYVIPIPEFIHKLPKFNQLFCRWVFRKFGEWMAVHVCLFPQFRENSFVIV